MSFYEVTSENFLGIFFITNKALFTINVQNTNNIMDKCKQVSIASKSLLAWGKKMNEKICSVILKVQE